MPETVAVARSWSCHNERNWYAKKEVVDSLEFPRVLTERLGREVAYHLRKPL